MEPGLIFATALCFLVGLSLGLLGGGGSVLIVPIFIYVARVPVNEAIAMSLVIVGISSAAGAMKYLLAGFVNKRLVALFVFPGAIASFAGAYAASRLPAELLLFMFSILMVLISGALFMNPPRKATGKEVVYCRPGMAVSVAAGAVIGFLTGLLGVGGGFLIVPVIALLMRCSLYTAIGTSLAVISINAMSGFIGHLSMMSLDIPLAALFLLSTTAGVFAGARYTERVSAASLQKGFAVLIFIVGCLIAIQHVPYK